MAWNGRVGGSQGDTLLQNITIFIIISKTITMNNYINTLYYYTGYTYTKTNEHTPINTPTR